MAKSANKAIIIGHLVEDPSMIVKGETKVVKTRVVTNQPAKVMIDGKEEWQEEPEFHRIEVWGRDAEYLQTKGRKGSLMAIFDARIKYGEYEDKNFVDVRENTKGQFLKRPTIVIHVNPNGFVLGPSAAERAESGTANVPAGVVPVTVASSIPSIENPPF